MTGKNMADLGQNRHFFPAIIIPSKVVSILARFNVGVWGLLNYGYPF